MDLSSNSCPVGFPTNNFYAFLSLRPALISLLELIRFWWGNLMERDHWGDQDVDGRTILRWILRKWEGVVGTGWSWLRIGTVGGRL